LKSCFQPKGYAAFLIYTLFDRTSHELAFLPVVLAPLPWADKGLEYMKTGVPHVFFDKLRGKDLNLDRLLTALKGLSLERCDAYLASLPPQWSDEFAEAERMVDHIRQLKVHADAAINEVLRVLK